MSPMPRRRPARKSGRKRAGVAAGGSPASSGRPSATHFGSPPSSTAARSWPNSPIIHQPRAAEASAFWS